MYISNYLSLVSAMELVVIVPILRITDVISDQGCLINVVILFMFIINNGHSNKSILLCIFSIVIW